MRFNSVFLPAFAAIAISAGGEGCSRGSGQPTAGEETPPTQEGGGGGALSSLPEPEAPNPSAGAAGAQGESPSGDEKREPSHRLPCDVQTVFREVCHRCHLGREEPILSTLAEISAERSRIVGVLVGTGPREMPPPPFRLSDEQRETLLDWLQVDGPLPARLEEEECPL